MQKSPVDVSLEISLVPGTSVHAEKDLLELFDLLKANKEAITRILPAYSTYWFGADSCNELGKPCIVCYIPSPLPDNILDEVSAVFDGRYAVFNRVVMDQDEQHNDGSPNSTGSNKEGDSGDLQLNSNSKENS